MKQDANRVLARSGARELTPEEVARVSGGVSSLSATTNLITNILPGHVDTPEIDR
jgi:hypothetical protein